MVRFGIWKTTFIFTHRLILSISWNK